jgi:Bacterial Ig domain
MKNLFRCCRLSFSLLCMLVISAGTALAMPAQTMAPVTGEVEKITIDNPNNVWSGGTMTVQGQVIILPANLLINLPNDYQTLQQLYANAPAVCQGLGETGLAKTDKCNGRATGAQVNILANRTDSGNVIAGQVDIFKALETVNGTITYINYSDGYFRLNGNPGDPATGTMVRVNDPTSRHTIQSGHGCAAGNKVNCSPDVRFKVDPDNYTFAYITGYPPCIQTTDNVFNDANCPDANRPPITPITTSNPFAAPPVAADSRHFAPIKQGDSVAATGSFETVNGGTFLSAWAVKVLVDLTTRTTDQAGNPDLTQPDYLFINEASWDGPAYPAGRVRGRLETNASYHSEEIDYFSIHYDPVNNAPHEQILYTTQFNKQFGVVVFNVTTGASDSQIRMDFMPGAKVLGSEPCLALRGLEPKATGTPAIPGVEYYCNSTGTSPVQNYNLMVPVFREVMARGRRQHVVTGQALDIHGRPTQSGQYKLPTTIAYGAFEDINLGMGQFPFQFSGTPWLMDRRLSPNGCAGVCESAPQPLTPFPFEGIDPRVVAQTFGFVVNNVATQLPNPNRMFNFMQETAPGIFDMTGLLSWPPANPAAIPIAAIPPLNLFAPEAVNDTAGTPKNVAIKINVLANDVPTLGLIDPSSVAIVSPPANGLPTVNYDGSITYTPAGNFSGTDSFTYTVANTFGSVSNAATVTVNVASAPAPAPPVANNDTAIATAGGPAITINVLANDTATTNPIDPATVVVSPATGGTATANQDGTVQYTAPAGNGAYSFTYTVKDKLGVSSNAATVSVIVSVPPTAVNDAVAMSGGPGPGVVIPVTDNDLAGSKDINKASVAIVAQPVNGSAGPTPLTPGSVTYTPAPGFTGPADTFTYTVKDSQGLVSNAATVTVTVSAPASEALAVTRAQYQVGGASWLIAGTTTDRTAGGQVNIFNNQTVGTGLLGTASVDSNGSWTLSLTGPPQPNAQLKISVQSVQNPAAILEGVTLVVR